MPAAMHQHKMSYLTEGDKNVVLSNDGNELSSEVYNSGGLGGQQQPNGTKNNTNGGGMAATAVLSYRKQSEHFSISTTLPMSMGLQSRKGMDALHSSLANLPTSLDGSAPLPPSPSITPIVMMDPSRVREMNDAGGAGQHQLGQQGQWQGHYFDQQPHHLHQQQQQQYYLPYQQHQQLHQPQPRPSNAYCNGYGSQSNGGGGGGEGGGGGGGYQPHTLYSGNSSPAFPNSPTVETLHSAYSSPVIQHRSYESPQSSPIDLAAPYQRASQAQHHQQLQQPTFYDAKSTTSACFHLQVSAGAWQTSVTYGMLMAADFFAVITFSALNRRRVNQRVQKRDPQWVGFSTGILAMGYREDPILLEGCLKSLRAIRYQHNQRVMLVVDGSEQQDEYMVQIFMKVFEKQEAAVFRPYFLCMDREASDKAREDLMRQLAYHPGPVCVMQTHRGKRSAMYTGFAALLQQGIESVVVTDSDTYLDPASWHSHWQSPIVGAATGDVRIYNTGTWVSFLSSLRCWFAFNIERGAQSYHSVVSCVSGPLGIYRMSIVADGVLCTYGDDRHLANLVLREGYKVKFSHYAICYTDTPIRFIVWVTQQTRWSKSFFREIPIQLGCMMSSIMFVGLMKTAYAVRVTGDKRFFFTTIYGFLYMLGYVPAKIHAALMLYDNTWGTSARLIRNFTQLQSYIAPVTWGSLRLFGVTHNPARYSERAPISEGQPPPILTDETVIRILAGFGLPYFLASLGTL
ncbi:hyaluronan synthase [Mortierella sp. 14UC]|nr:hyaluronan synthase [Mortierella sp. 14UC]